MKLHPLWFLYFVLCCFGCSQPEPAQEPGNNEVSVNEATPSEQTVQEPASDASTSVEKNASELIVENLPDTQEPGDANPPETALEKPTVEVPSEAIPETTPTEPNPGTCPSGMVCVTSFPFRYNGDTSQSRSTQFNTYNCKTSADESGPEIIFRVEVKEEGFLSAAVYDGAGVDIDVHILTRLDENACIDRGDKHTRADVKPGIYYVVADSFVSGGKAQSGTFRLDIGFYVPSKGSCGMQTGVMKRVNDGGKSLPMPATGPIVMEAHLVTKDEPPPYPKTSKDKLPNHYEISQKETGFVMHRTQVWAPLEGGSFYGAGIGSPTLFPLLDESWYINMYWQRASRPARGTRMILRIPGTNRAVVVAAGYETGPGNLSHIGGTPEETHFYMKTGHRSVMQLGIATDQTLPFGPRICQ